MDPADRQELRDKISAMSPDKIGLMTMMVMNAKAIQWLKGRPENDQMGKLQCRYLAGGKWGEWNDEEPSFTVYDMLDCLIKDPFELNFVMCMEQWKGVQTAIHKEKILSLELPEGTAGVECRFVWDFRYEPEDVPPELIDPKMISVDDIIDVLIGMPAPPPGWAFPELVPLLCPLGAGPGWGCPDAPGGEQTPPPGGGG